MTFSPGDEAMMKGYINAARPFADMFSVKGKVALVTGGTSGLGFDIALRLLQGGAKVVVASNDQAEADAVMPLFEGQGFAEAVTFKLADVRKEADVEELVAFTVKTYGSLDIFVNSAAVWSFAKIYDLDTRDLERVFETNVYGAFYGVKHVSKYMKENDIQGKIVLISSNSPIVPYPVFGGYPHYASSKSAVMGLATEAASELKRFGIMVNSVAPGGMVTPGAASNIASEYLTDEQAEEFYDELAVWSVDGQLPVDQVGIIAYAFCTAMADGITGETIVVDGGASHNIVRYQPAIDAYPED